MRFSRGKAGLTRISRLRGVVCSALQTFIRQSVARHMEQECEAATFTSSRPGPILGGVPMRGSPSYGPTIEE